MLGFFKKIFGSEETQEVKSESHESPFPFTPSITGGEEDLTTFVKFVVCALVDKPDSVSLETKDSEKLITIVVTCEKEDIGKIIGKNGKTIEALRSLVNGAAGRLNKRATVEVND